MKPEMRSGVFEGGKKRKPSRPSSHLSHDYLTGRRIDERNAFENRISRLDPAATSPMTTKPDGEFVLVKQTPRQLLILIRRAGDRNSYPYICIAFATAKYVERNAR
jgi:hypothetical protein